MNRTFARMARRAVAVAAAATVWVASPGWGMDLQQAYDAALEQDATLRAARASTDAARERLPQARSQLLPNISANISRTLNDLTRTQPVLGKPTTTEESYISYSQTLQVRQPLYRKALWAGLNQAEYLVQDAEATLDREVQNLGVRVAGAYLEALLAQDQLDLIRKQKDVTTVQLDVARKSLEAGAGTRTDIDEAQAKLDMTLAQELEAQQHVDYTRRQLEVLVNQPVGGLARVDAAKLALQPPQPSDLKAWLEQAEANSPEMLSLQARLEAARMEVDKAQAGNYPTLDAVGQISRSASESATSVGSKYTNSSIGVQLNVPLFAGGYVDSVVRQALAEQTKAEELLEATRRDLSVRVHREYRGVAEGVLKVRALEQAVKSAEQLVFSSRRSFEAGVRTTVDILNAEQQLQLARRDLAQARYSYMMALVRLNALAGTDKAKTIAEVNAWLTAP